MWILLVRNGDEVLKKEWYQRCLGRIDHVFDAFRLPKVMLPNRESRPLRENEPTLPMYDGATEAPETCAVEGL